MTGQNKETEATAHLARIRRSFLLEITGGPFIAFGIFDKKIPADSGTQFRGSQGDGSCTGDPEISKHPAVVHHLEGNPACFARRVLKWLSWLLPKSAAKKAIRS